MSRTSNTKRYYEIARDCLRSAQHADNPATRDKLLDQAQVWMDAAMRETFIATIGAGDPHEPSQPDLRNEARALRSGSRRAMSRKPSCLSRAATARQDWGDEDGRHGPK